MSVGQTTATSLKAVLLAIALALNMPTNLAVLRWDEEQGDPDRWRQLRRRWDRTTPRALRDSAGFAFFGAAAVWQ